MPRNCAHVIKPTVDYGLRDRERCLCPLSDTEGEKYAVSVHVSERGRGVGRVQAGAADYGEESANKVPGLRNQLARRYNKVV